MTLVDLFDYGLEMRGYNVLHNAGIETAEDAAKLTIKELTLLKGCGKKGAKAIRIALADAGYEPASSICPLCKQRR